MATMIVYPETVFFRQVTTDVTKRTWHLPGDNSKQLPVLNFIGTVKLHGTNAAIGYRQGAGHWCQSRNRVITPIEDNVGFAQCIDSLADEFFNVHILPHCPTIREHYERGNSIIIFGEWCAGNIQKNVAICGLPTMFVIFKVRIVNRLEKAKATASTDKHDQQQKPPRTFWLDPNEWRNIRWHDRSIYNIYDFPIYTIDIDFNKPELSQNKLTAITEEVERQCPVGAHFGRTGTGEGIVWMEWTMTNGDLAFKVKGREHLVSNVQALASVTVTVVADVREFIEYACTENRMRQALEYMREQNVSIEMKTMIIFLRWLTEDIFKEEKDCMNTSNISAKDVNRAIANKAETWFIETIAGNRIKTNNRQKRGGNK